MILSTGELADLRSIAEGEMVDTFTAYASTLATTGGLEVDDWQAQYETPGKVTGQNAPDTYTRTVRVGGVDRPVLEGGLRLPLTADLPSIGWEYECTAVGVDSDPQLLGRRWRVMSVPTKTMAVERRLDVVELERT